MLLSEFFFNIRKYIKVFLEFPTAVLSDERCNIVITISMGLSHLDLKRAE